MPIRLMVVIGEFGYPYNQLNRWVVASATAPNVVCE
jgi:hypothetical protein